MGTIILIGALGIIAVIVVTAVAERSRAAGEHAGYPARQSIPQGKVRGDSLAAEAR